MTIRCVNNVPNPVAPGQTKRCGWETQIKEGQDRPRTCPSCGQSARFSAVVQVNEV